MRPVGALELKMCHELPAPPAVSFGGGLGPQQFEAGLGVRQRREHFPRGLHNIPKPVTILQNRAGKPDHRCNWPSSLQRCSFAAPAFAIQKTPALFWVRKLGRNSPSGFCSARATHVDLDFKIYSNVVWARFK